MRSDYIPGGPSAGLAHPFSTAVPSQKPSTSDEAPSVGPVCFIILVDFVVVFGYLALLPSWVFVYTDDVLDLGLITAAGNVALMVGTVVCGKLADRIGAKHTLV